jgi:hypothetical protein
VGPKYAAQGRLAMAMVIVIRAYRVVMSRVMRMVVGVRPARVLVTNLVFPHLWECRVKPGLCTTMPFVRDSWIWNLRRIAVHGERR